MCVCLCVYCNHVYVSVRVNTNMCVYVCVLRGIGRSNSLCGYVCVCGWVCIQCQCHEQTPVLWQAMRKIPEEEGWHLFLPPRPPGTSETARTFHTTDAITRQRFRSILHILDRSLMPEIRHESLIENEGVIFPQVNVKHKMNESFFQT